MQAERVSAIAAPIKYCRLFLTSILILIPVILNAIQAMTPFNKLIPTKAAIRNGNIGINFTNPTRAVTPAIQARDQHKT